MNIIDRLNQHKLYREKALIFFLAPFMLHLQNNKSLGKYFYIKYITNNMTFCDTIEQFVNTLLVEREVAATELGFTEEFDWVNHCYQTARIAEHSKEFALNNRNYLFNNNDIRTMTIKFYEDLLAGNASRVTKILSNISPFKIT